MLNKGLILKLISAICTRVHDKEGYVTKTKLIKYLYLIDVEFYRRHKRTFTGFNWVFYDFGPWSYEYNEVFDEMSKSPLFRIKEGNHLQYDTQFILCTEREEFDAIFDEVSDEHTTKRIVDKWALEHLNNLLNYVYFKTEPMVGAERYKPLDFTKIHTLEPIPKFKLSHGMEDPKKVASIRNHIKERILSLKKSQPEDTTYTPPNYDDAYFELIERMNRDEEH